jgi:hypothetical protein
VRADALLVDRHVSPAEHRLPFLCDDRLDESLELEPAGTVLREEAHCDAVGTGRGQRHARNLAEKRVRDLHEDPRAVAGLGICSGGAAVLEVLERGQRAIDGLVRLSTVEPRDEGNAAGIVLERGVIKPRLPGLRLPA